MIDLIIEFKTGFITILNISLAQTSFSLLLTLTLKHISFFRWCQTFPVPSFKGTVSNWPQYRVPLRRRLRQDTMGQFILHWSSMQSLSKSLLERGRFVGWLGWVLGKDSWIFQEVSKRCWLWIDQWTILWWYLQVNKMFLFSVNNLRKIVVLANKKMSYYSLFIKYLIAVWLISIKFKDSVQLKSEECRHVFFLVCNKRWSKFCIYCILLTVEQLKEYYCLRYKITHGFDFLFFFYGL